MICTLVSEGAALDPKAAQISEYLAVNQALISPHCHLDSQLTEKCPKVMHKARRQQAWSSCVRIAKHKQWITSTTSREATSALKASEMNVPELFREKFWLQYFDMQTYLPFSFMLLLSFLWKGRETVQKKWRHENYKSKLGNDQEIWTCVSVDRMVVGLHMKNTNMMFYIIA